MKTFLAPVLLAAALAASPAAAVNFYGVDLTGALVTFDSSTPGTISSTRAITGLGSASLRGIDFRPNGGGLYGLGSNNTLYQIDVASGFASAVGGAFTPLAGNNFAFDFNAAIDRIRVVSDTNNNYVLNPITGALQATATNVFYRSGDANFGTDPSIVAAAYSNNVNGAASTQLYVLDSVLNVLARQDNNNGFLDTVGALGFDIGADASFDITAAGVAYVSSGNDFYSINLDSGALTRNGGTAGLAHISSGPFIAAVPEPATWAMMIGGFGLVGGTLRRRKPLLATA